MTARLQAATASSKPVLLRVDFAWRTRHAGRYSGTGHRTNGSGVFDVVAKF